MQNENIILLSIGLYLILLIFLGLYASKKRASNSLKDFYLAGSGLGSFILVLTLYATQYSGNTLLGVSGEVVRRGMSMILILGYMTAIIVFYLTFAPALYQISRLHAFITPGDWFDFRFKMPALSLLANVTLLVACINFLLSQLMAMGHIANGITGGQIPYWVGVVFLATIVIVYETLGGLRAVAWTDVFQGLMLLIGLVGLFLIVIPTPAAIGEISNWLMDHAPDKIAVPPPSFQLYWISTVLMVGLGAAVYPQAIQRIYAAKSVQVLKRSLSIMVFMPLFTILILFLLGIVSIPHFADTDGIAADAVLPQMLQIWAEKSMLSFVLMVLVIVGMLAAIMSTADSVLLSISSIIAKDILGKTTMRDHPEEQLTKAGKIVSWIVMLLVVVVALQPRITLWGLIELKMQILIQVAPLFLLGVHFPKVTAKAMFIGLIAGLLFSTITFSIGAKTIFNVQAGLLALILNLSLCLVLSSLKRLNLRKIKEQ